MDRDKMAVIWMTEKEYRDIIDAFGGFILYEDRDESLGDLLRKRRTDYMWPETVAPEGIAPEDMPLSWLRLGTRASNLMRGLGVKTCGELAAYREEDLLSRTNLGRKTLDEIRQALELRGMRLRREDDLLSRMTWGARRSAGGGGQGCMT